MSGVEFHPRALDANLDTLSLQSTFFTAAPDAHASISVAVGDMKKVFKMKVYDNTGENIRFYINKPLFNQYIVLSGAEMETSSDIYGNGTQDKDMGTGGGSNQFAHDFLRFISFKIFGSSNGVGLFTNKTEVIDDITNNFISKNNVVLSALDSSANTAGMKTQGGLTVEVKNDLDGISGFYVDCSGGNQNALNIGWSLFQNLVSSNWTRASAFLINSTPDTLTGFPFIVGDTISVYVTVNANPLQKSVSTMANSAIDSRTYRIRIKIIADPV